MRAKPILEFGDFRFDPEQRLLTRESRCLELAPKALEILAVLLRNAGRIVSKDHLLDMVWPDSAVEEGNLAVHIFALRRALGDSSRAKHIETIPRRGYRFVTPVSFAGGDCEPAFDDRLHDPTGSPRTICSNRHWRAAEELRRNTGSSSTASRTV